MLKTDETGSLLSEIVSTHTQAEYTKDSNIHLFKPRLWYSCKYFHSLISIYIWQGALAIHVM